MMFASTTGAAVVTAGTDASATLHRIRLRDARHLRARANADALHLRHDDPCERGRGGRDRERRNHAPTQHAAARLFRRSRCRRRQHVRFGLEARRERRHERAAAHRAFGEIVGTQRVADQMIVGPRRAVLARQFRQELTDVPISPSDSPSTNADMRSPRELACEFPCACIETDPMMLPNPSKPAVVTPPNPDIASVSRSFQPSYQRLPSGVSNNGRNFAAMASRARKILDLTVPIGQSIISAISS